MKIRDVMSSWRINIWDINFLRTLPLEWYYALTILYPYNRYNLLSKVPYYLCFTYVFMFPKIQKKYVYYLCQKFLLLNMFLDQRKVFTFVVVTVVVV